MENVFFFLLLKHNGLVTLTMKGRIEGKTCKGRFKKGKICKTYNHGAYWKENMPTTER